MILSALQASIIVIVALAFAVVIGFVFLRTPLSKTLNRVLYLGLVLIALLAAIIVTTDTWFADIV